MNATEISTLASVDGLHHPIRYIKDANGITVLDGYVVLPVAAVSAYFTGNDDIDVKTASGDIIGTLCFCRVLRSVEINTLPYLKYIAYLNEVDADSISGTYAFQSDYLILKKTKLNTYKKMHMHKSAIWGGFVHDETFKLLPKPVQNDPTTIIAIDDITLPTQHHEVSLIRSVVEPYAFERFLKLFHLLELVFDWDIVQQIKKLNDDLVGIGQLLSAYKAQELVLLKRTLADRCKNVASIAEKMDSISHYTTIAKTIFYDYSKEGTTIDVNKFNEIIANGGFTNRLNFSDYDSKIISIVSYWIYRIRCSIAHNRIGEYVMTQNDEEFIVCFAEPLLREIVIQCFKK